eukprot:5992447-Prorocentrum_lima.AAC.1
MPSLRASPPQPFSSNPRVGCETHGVVPRVRCIGGGNTLQLITEALRLPVTVLASGSGLPVVYKCLQVVYGWSTG